MKGSHGSLVSGVCGMMTKLLSDQVNSIKLDGCGWRVCVSVIVFVLRTDERLPDPTAAV